MGKQIARTLRWWRESLHTETHHSARPSNVRKRGEKRTGCACPAHNMPHLHVQHFPFPRRSNWQLVTSTRPSPDHPHQGRLMLPTTTFHRSARMWWAVGNCWLRGPASLWNEVKAECWEQTNLRMGLKASQCMPERVASRCTLQIAEGGKKAHAYPNVTAEAWTQANFNFSGPNVQVLLKSTLLLRLGRNCSSYILDIFSIYQRIIQLR